MIRNTLSNWIANSVYVKKGKRFSFKGRAWVPALFDTPARKRVWKMSRQVGKSTGGAAEACARQCLIDNFYILYVAPEQDQTRKYSHDKLKPIIEESPIINLHKGWPENVFERGFVRPSGGMGKIYLKYAKHNPDSCRGITADMVHYDEIQDQDLAVTEPVIREVMFTSEHGISLYTGTPKSLVNPVEKKWRMSDQREWLVRCHHHSPVKYIRLGIKSIGKLGPICHHCGNLLDVDDGLWVKHNPGAKIAGFHVNQLHCKISHSLPHKWEEILDKFEDTDRSLFLNEVLGESADTAEVPINEAVLKKICDPDFVMSDDPRPKTMNYYNFAGIDWGHGQFSTTLAIGQMDQSVGKFRYVYLKKYEGKQCSPKFCIPDMVRIINRFQCARVHGDHGGGFGLNDRLEEELAKTGRDGLVTSNYWSNSATSKDASWVTAGQLIPRLTLNKTNALATFIRKMHQRKLLFPQWKDLAPFSEHFTNVRKEINERDGTFRYDRAGMDDMFHACAYAEVIAKAYFASGF